MIACTRLSRGFAIFAAQEAANNAKGNARKLARRWACSMRFRDILFGVVVLALAGCGGASNDPGAFLIDPGRYSVYHCDDLAARGKVLAARAKELSGLMEKAGEGAGGAVIGSLAYRTDYDSVLSEERLLQKTAMEKNCGFTAEFQSDRGIR
jgi:hypothetical protein